MERLHRAGPRSRLWPGSFPRPLPRPLPRLLVELALSSSTKSADFHYYHAHALLELGRTEGALDALNRYVALDPAKGVYLTADWWFRKVHDHPRFRTMIGNQGD